MYPKKFNTNRNNDSVYHSSTSDYLVSRTKTFQQNQFQYFRSGVDNKYKTGENYDSYFNDYSPQGIPHCYYSGNISTTPLSQLPHRKVVYKPNNWKFGTQGGVDATGLTSHKNTLCNRMCALPPPPITEPIINYGPELVKNGDFSYPLVYGVTRILNNDDSENFGWLMEFTNIIGQYIIFNNNLGFSRFYNDTRVNNYLSISQVIKPLINQLDNTQFNQFINISTPSECEYNLTIIYGNITPELSKLKISIDNDVIGYIDNNTFQMRILYTFSKNFIIGNTPRNINLVIKSDGLRTSSINDNLQNNNLVISNEGFQTTAINIISVSLKQVIK
jgi:hypothetical protein